MVTMYKFASDQQNPIPFRKDLQQSYSEVLTRLTFDIFPNYNHLVILFDI